MNLLAPSGSAAGQSRFIDRSHSYSAFAPLEALRSAISTSGADFVIPCDDRAVRQMLLLGQYHGEYSSLIARSLGRLQSYPTLMSRTDLIAAAEAEGIRVPPTRALASEADLESGLSHFGVPVVLKSDGSWGGDGVAVTYTRDQARAAWRRLSEPLSPLRALARSLRRRDGHHLADAIAPARPQLSMQLFVPGTPATTAFACWQGKVLGAVHVDVVQGDGATGPASVVRRSHDPAMDAAARKLAHRFGLSGLHGLDFIRDAAGDVHLLEINPRATQIAALAFGEAGDLPAALTARIADRTVPVRRAPVSADTVALFPQEWRRDPASPWLAAAHHDVPWDDPALLSACMAPPRHAPIWEWLSELRPAAAPASLPPGNHPALASKL